MSRPGGGRLLVGSAHSGPLAHKEFSRWICLEGWLFRFVSFRGLAVAAACAGLLAGCARRGWSRGSGPPCRRRRGPGILWLEFSCHAEHYDSVEHCVEVLSLPEDASEECGAAYDEILSCLTEMDSCRSLRPYLRQPERTRGRTCRATCAAEPTPMTSSSRPGARGRGRSRDTGPPTHGLRRANAP